MASVLRFKRGLTPKVGRATSPKNHVSVLSPRVLLRRFSIAFIELVRYVILGTLVEHARILSED